MLQLLLSSWHDFLNSSSISSDPFCKRRSYASFLFWIGSVISSLHHSLPSSYYLAFLTWSALWQCSSKCLIPPLAPFPTLKCPMIYSLFSFLSWYVLWHYSSKYLLRPLSPFPTWYARFLPSFSLSYPEMSHDYSPLSFSYPAVFYDTTRRNPCLPHSPFYTLKFPITILCT